jgi:hypothetical protein
MTAAHSKKTVLEKTADQPASEGLRYPANVWISHDKKEVLVTGGNITFHEGREFHCGRLTEKSDLDCALVAFEKGFNCYYKKNSN